MVATSKHNAVKTQSFQSVASSSHVLSGGSFTCLLRRSSFTGGPAHARNASYGPASATEEFAANGAACVGVCALDRGGSIRAEFKMNVSSDAT